MNDDDDVTKRLVDLLGPAQTKAMRYTGMPIDARRAYELGLVNDVFDADAAERMTVGFAETITSRAQYSVRSTKRIVELISAGLAAENDETLALRSAAFQTADYREGVRAFMEKRPANFRDV